MNIKTNRLLWSAILVFAASATPAQETATSPKPKATLRAITGCLAKGDGSDEFLLTAKNGSTWEVKSDTVALADHVGHTITARGKVTNAKMHNLKEDAKDAAKDSGLKKTDTEHGHLKVTSIKMVSESCK
jgi:hypothetical protein